MSSAARGQMLKLLQWGTPEGPTSYDGLTGPIAAVARTVDSIGDDLAANRVRFFEGLPSQSDPILQAHLLAYTLVDQVLPRHLNELPDRQAVWTRRELEGDAFDAAALDAAFEFYAARGEPNVFRQAERAAGRPALGDLRALQLLARELCETAEGMEEAGLTPSRLLEDFARLHWSNQRETLGLGKDWELHPFGMAVLAAIHAVQRYPAEEAEAPELAEPEVDQAADPEPWRTASDEPDFGSSWTPPTPRRPIS